jgi:hypothetical protein
MTEWSNCSWTLRDGTQCRGKAVDEERLYCWGHRRQVNDIAKENARREAAGLLPMNEMLQSNYLLQLRRERRVAMEQLEPSKG